jgi:antitoxin YefM
MNAMSYTTVRAKLSEIIEQVCDDHSPIIITRANKCPVVLVSLEDYQSLEETAYLLRSPRNAQRLLKSIAELKNGKGKERQLIKE